MGELTDTESADKLLRRVAGGDRAALGQLFRLEAGRLLAIARRIVRRPELAEEVLQDAFVSIWTRAAQFDAARGSGRAWITAIVRNRALNMVRDGGRLDFHDADSLAEIGDRAGDALAAYGALAETDMLKRCLGALEEEKRRSILLAYVVGMTHDEISRELSAPLGTVKAWIRRGVVALQECLS